MPLQSIRSANVLVPPFVSDLGRLNSKEMSVCLSGASSAFTELQIYNPCVPSAHCIVCGKVMQFDGLHSVSPLQSSVHCPLLPNDNQVFIDWSHPECALVRASAARDLLEFNTVVGVNLQSSFAQLVKEPLFSSPSVALEATSRVSAEFLALTRAWTRSYVASQKSAIDLSPVIKRVGGHLTHGMVANEYLSYTIHIAQLSKPLREPGLWCNDQTLSFSAFRGLFTFVFSNRMNSSSHAGDELNDAFRALIESSSKRLVNVDRHVDGRSGLPNSTSVLVKCNSWLRRGRNAGDFFLVTKIGYPDEFLRDLYFVLVQTRSELRPTAAWAVHDWQLIQQRIDAARVEFAQIVQSIQESLTSIRPDIHGMFDSRLQTSFPVSHAEFDGESLKLCVNSITAEKAGVRTGSLSNVVSGWIVPPGWGFKSNGAVPMLYDIVIDNPSDSEWASTIDMPVEIAPTIFQTSYATVRDTNQLQSPLRFADAGRYRDGIDGCYIAVAS